MVEYRYSGSSDIVKNYVSFNNETWRIIGVIPTDDGTGKYEERLKIIRDESIGYYSWDTSAKGINDFICNNIQYYGGGINQWGESGTYEGADLMRLLNLGYESESINNSLYWNRESGTCYNGSNNATTACDFSEIGLISDAKSMIGDAKWYTSTSNIGVETLDSYKNERGNMIGIADTGISITKTTSWIGKVGLMYPSDYGYASSGCRNGEQLLNYYNNDVCINTNWLYNTDSQWTNSPHSGNRNTVRYIHFSGLAGSTINALVFAVRLLHI